jgi:hypothetical protein
MRRIDFLWLFLIVGLLLAFVFEFLAVRQERARFAAYRLGESDSQVRALARHVAYVRGLYEAAPDDYVWLDPKTGTALPPLLRRPWREGASDVSAD